MNGIQIAKMRDLKTQFNESLKKEIYLIYRIIGIEVIYIFSSGWKRSVIFTEIELSQQISCVHGMHGNT